MADESSRNESSSLGSSLASSANPAASGDASTEQVSELVQRLVAALQQTGGNIKTVLSQAIAAAAVQQSADASAGSAAQGQTRLARPGDGAAPMFTPPALSVAASVQPPGSAYSAASASTSRTPIMRHTNHSNDDTPFVVAAEKATKAPELLEGEITPLGASQSPTGSLPMESTKSHCRELATSFCLRRWRS